MDYFAMLKAFTRSAQLGSFSKAAAEQAVKISTISRYVGALENDVGAALFNRSTRRLQLTEAGAALYERASHILAELDSARDSIKGLNSRPQGLLRVTVPGAFGRRHLMPHLPVFLKRYPDIRLDLTIENRIVDLIEVSADVAIRIGVLQDSSIIAKRIGAHERVLVASAAYVAEQAPIEKPDDLCRHDCMSFALDAGAEWYCRPVGEAQIEQRGVLVAGRLRINDFEALLQAAIDGLGVGLLPRWLIAAEVRNGSLVALLPGWLWSIHAGAEPAIWAVYPPKKVVSPKVRVFIDFVAELIKQEKSWH